MTRAVRHSPQTADSLSALVLIAAGAQDEEVAQQASLGLLIAAMGEG